MEMSPIDLLWIVLVGTALILIFIGFFIAVVVRNQRRFIATQKAKLKESERVRDLLQEIPKQILKAHEEERARVARDLHDGINQMLASIKYRLHTTKARAHGDKVLDESFEHLLGDMERTMEEVKRISHNLHPKSLDELGFKVALRNLCDEFSERTRIPVRTELEFLPEKMEDDIKIGLFRIIQESFQNIEKYAHASEVSIVTENNLSSLFRVTISDNGKGFDLKETGVGSHGKYQGLGITTMKERATLIGGTLDIQSKESAGTQTTISVPISDL